MKKVVCKRSAYHKTYYRTHARLKLKMKNPRVWVSCPMCGLYASLVHFEKPVSVRSKLIFGSRWQDIPADEGVQYIAWQVERDSMRVILAKIKSFLTFCAKRGYATQEEILSFLTVQKLSSVSSVRSVYRPRMLLTPVAVSKPFFIKKLMGVENHG